jgi:ribosomal protein S18 acetylase RimI-like enzyme
MEIRPAIPDDVACVLPMAAKIAALHQQWDPAKFGYKDHPEEMYRGWLKSRAIDPRSVFLVADRDGLLAEFGFIHDIWVEPEYRNEGVGRQLVMLAIEKFRDMGVKQVRGDTAAANDAARGLLKSCGMRPSTVEMLFEL